MNLEMLSGPVIGAVIGYCTNYIAVKMLFYPRKEIRVMGRKLPFTPGAIPKGKPRLAKAVANIVAHTLLTEEDLKKTIMSSDMQNAAVEKIMDGLSMNIGELLPPVFPSEERYEGFKENMTDVLTEQILEAVSRVEIGNVIAEEGQRIVKEKTAGTMISMFLSDDLLASLVGPMGAEIEKYICENGRSYIKPEVLSGLSTLENTSVPELLGKAEISEEEVRHMVTSVYGAVMDNVAGNMIRQMNIMGIIEQKINEMSVKELENMVLTVMKKELDAIVNLGAVVGAVLGFFNLFF